MMLRKLRSAAVVFSLLLLCDVKVNAQTFPAGFSQVKIASIDQASAMAFAPDGRIFVCQKTGQVRIIKNGNLLSTPFLTLSVDVNGERGISGIIFDPDFNTNHYLYIYYTATSPTIHNRLSRFTANGDVVQSGSEVPLLDIETVSAIYHNGGGMVFGNDGKLYLSIGEDNKPSNSQSLTTVKGKLIRINKDGTAPSDNPYASSTNSATKKIWCLGLRNPYTMAIQKSTGKIFVNNVGADSYEEIHDGTPPDQNFGWPDVEGYSSNSAYDNPYFAYPHESTGQRGCAVTGGAFFNPPATNYPAEYHNKYFYMDYCNRWIYYLSLGSGTPVNKVFATNLTTQNLALQVGPDGNLYYLNRYDTKAGVWKIIYTSNNSPVVTSHPQSQTITQGQPVTFSVSASGATPLSYQWKKNGINISGANSATYSIASVQQSDAGQYSCQVSNSYGSALSNSATLTVAAFNAQPVATIITPANGTLYTAGQTISFTGDATDEEDGTLPASAFQWIVDFYHNNNHYHPGPVIPPGSKSGSFTIPNTGEVSAVVFYRLKLVVTDTDGLTDTTYVDLLPRTSTLQFNTVPPGLKIAFDNQPHTTPFSMLVVEGMNINIAPVSPQVMNGSAYTFDYWSHGGAASQTIVVGQNDQTYSAVYKDTVLSCTAEGKITREYWANVSSSSLSSSIFNTTPTSTSQLTLFQGPSSAGENYNSRIRGYICPPQTGNYTFWIASDNNSELWLSTDEQPAGKVKIAYVGTYTASKEWTKFSSQQSQPIALTAGMKYYIEAVHHEGTQGDNLAVGWQLPDGTYERPIPGSRLSPFTSIPEPPPASSDELIAAGSSWRYLDNGTDQGSTWRSLSFNDGSWKTGNAQLGYGDGDEATVVSYGSSSGSKYITTYFRKKFNVTSASSVTALELHLLRDDGAIVYINGTEVARTNMTDGPVTYTTRAITYIDGSAESAFNVFQLNPSVLISGENVIAVEIHQNSSSSSDISFNLKLKASGTSSGGGTAPVVSITSPANNTSFSSPANITINANASTSSGSITKVEFYSSDVKIGEDLTSPYSFTWENVSTGNYMLRAKAFTSEGTNAFSSYVSVSVTSCSTPTITPSGPTRICSGSVVLNSNTGSGFSYQWKKDGVNISGATSSSYTATTSGDYQVRVIVGSCVGWSAPTRVRIESGLAATITAGGPTTFCQGQNVVLYGNTCSGYSYQWKKDGSDIPGANSSTYTVTASGEYQLKVTLNGQNAWSSKLTVTVNNCTDEITETQTITENNAIENSAAENFEMKVFPNPNTGLFTINLRIPVVENEKVKISVLNLVGEQVFSKELSAAEYITETIELDQSIKAGVYILQVVNGSKAESINMVLTR